MVVNYGGKPRWKTEVIKGGKPGWETEVENRGGNLKGIQGWWKARVGSRGGKQGWKSKGDTDVENKAVGWVEIQRGYRGEKQSSGN